MPNKKTSARKAPWNKPSPKKGKPTKLTEASKAAAKARAEKAGRPYPNLIENMHAAAEQLREGRSP